MLYAASSIRAGSDNIFNHRLRSYTDCMAGGNRDIDDCHSLRLDIESETNPVADVITMISIAFLNFASLSFVIQFQTIKKVVGKAAKKFNTKTIK